MRNTLDQRLFREIPVFNDEPILFGGCGREVDRSTRESFWKEVSKRGWNEIPLQIDLKLEQMGDEIYFCLSAKPDYQTKYPQ